MSTAFILISCNINKYIKFGTVVVVTPTNINITKKKNMIVLLDFYVVVPINLQPRPSPARFAISYFVETQS